MNPLLSLDSSSTESDDFMWRAHQRNAVRLGRILRQSSIGHNYQEQWHDRQLPPPPSPRWSHKLSQMIRILINPRFHTGSAVNIQLCHSASMISICHPTHSMCWLIRPWSNQTKSTAPNDRSHLSRSNLYAPRNLSAIEGWETTYTTTVDNTIYSEDEPRRVYWDDSSSETLGSNEPRQVFFASSPSSTPPPPRGQKESWAWGCFFTKWGDCRSTPARHAASPYQPKRHPDAQEKLKH